MVVMSITMESGKSVVTIYANEPLVFCKKLFGFYFELTIKFKQLIRTAQWQRWLSLSVAWYTKCHDVQGQPDNMLKELVLIVGNTLFAINA